MNLPGLYFRSRDGLTLLTFEDVRGHGTPVSAVRLRVHSGPGDVELNLGDVHQARDWLDSIITSTTAQNPRR
jgi:hypothetical protein